MKANNSFTIDFITRLNKNDKSKALVYARITVNGERTEISLKEQVDPECWDSDREEVIGKSQAFKGINKYIEDVRYKLKEKYRMLLDKGSTITVDCIKQAYLGRNSVQKSEHTLCELIDLHTKIQFPKLRPGTTKNYNATEKYVKAFMPDKYKSGDINLLALDFEFITELEYHIRNHPIKKEDPCAGNGVYKHLERLKKMVNWGKQLKWIKENPFADYKLEFKRTKRKKLTIQELVLIENKKLQSSKLEYVRDLFLFSCYTGFCFADVIKLKKVDFEQINGRVFCKIYRQKNDELAFVPLFNTALDLIAKYVDHPASIQNGTIFPPTSNQEVNRCLKLIQEICSIEKEMTFHLGRHTFATSVTLKNGVPIETVSKMLGHTKLTITQIYADVDEEKIIADTAGIENRLILHKKELTLPGALGV